MKIKQLGNGGAFDFDSVNSSFLIDIGDKRFPEYLLFDCGYSVYAELRKQHKEEQIDLRYLTKVYISHMDDDHIGSLKTLIYYMFFVQNVTLEIITHKEVYESLKEYLSDIDGFVRDGRKIEGSLFYLTKGIHGIKISNTHKMYFTPTYHFKPCYGVGIAEIVNNLEEKVLFISGDTKAHHTTRDEMEKYKIKYHGFSNYNDVNRQVHACKQDFEQYYSKIDNIVKYHNNEEFDNTWKKL